MQPGRENWLVPWTQSDDPYASVRTGDTFTPMGGREYANYQNYYDPLANNQDASRLSPTQRMWNVLQTPIPSEYFSIPIEREDNPNWEIYRNMETERQNKYNRVQDLMKNKNMSLEQAVDRVTLRDAGANQPRQTSSTPSYAEYLRNYNTQTTAGPNWKDPVPEKMSPGMYGLSRGINALSGAFDRSINKAFSNKPKPPTEYYTRPIESQTDYKRSSLSSMGGVPVPLGLRNFGESVISTSLGSNFADQSLFGRPAGEIISPDKQTKAQRVGAYAGMFSPTPGTLLGGTTAGMLARLGMRGTSLGMRGAAKGMETLGLKGVRSATPDALRNQGKNLMEVANNFRITSTPKTQKLTELANDFRFTSTPKTQKPKLPESGETKPFWNQSFQPGSTLSSGFKGAKNSSSFSPTQRFTVPKRNDLASRPVTAPKTPNTTSTPKINSTSTMMNPIPKLK